MNDAVEYVHPSFERAAQLSEPLRATANTFEAGRCRQPMGKRYLAQTRVECAWRAYVDAVPGMDHRHEIEAVANYGATLDERIARILFPEFADVPYAD